MDFDTIKKNKPNLTDYKFLQKIIENKKQEIIIYEPTLIDKMCDKIKNSFYLFIENNIFILSIIMFIIILLIYRYFQYQNIKNKILIDQSQYDIDYVSSIIDQLNSDKLITNEHYQQTYPITKNSSGKKLFREKNNKQHEKIITDKQNLSLINSSSYAPYNLRNMNDFHNVVI